MLATGANVRTVEEILGYSSLSMTELCTHVTSDAKRLAVQRIDLPILTSGQRVDIEKDVENKG
jgi:site-specific recombinase XerC